MENDRGNANSSIKQGDTIAGYPVVNFGGLLAIGRANGRGGFSLQRFRVQRANNLISQLNRMGVKSNMRRSANDYIVVVDSI